MSKKIKISLLDLRREYNFLKKEIRKQWRDCLLSQDWILGRKVKEFEEEIARYLGVKYTVGVASGTDALLLSLRALAIKRKKKEFFDKSDEIITSALSFISTAEAIVLSGATPVFVDIDPVTFNLNPHEVKKAVTKNTVGILPVHLYGLGADISSLRKISREYNLFILEDTAQSLGAEYTQKKLGTFTQAGAFSFFPSKHLGGWGDGGLVATNNKELCQIIRWLRNHGERKKYQAYYLGHNSRLDSFQAGVLLAKLPYLDRFNLLRRQVAHSYTQKLKELKEIQPPYEPRDYLHVYHLYTIKVSSSLRNELLASLNKRGIQARIYYPLPLYEMKAFRRFFRNNSFENLKKVISQIISLPIHPFLRKEEIFYVIETIQNYLRKRKIIISVSFRERRGSL